MHKLNLLLISFLTLSFVQFNNKESKISSDVTQKVEKKWLSDTITFKNKKLLATFSDTSLLERYIEEIKLFKENDSVNNEREVDILFTGSSSIRKWNTLSEDMSNCKILNRGFGGSTIPEVIYFSEILIFKHKPSKIVLYAGENDIAEPGTNIEKVFESFLYLQKLIKKRLPQTHLYFVSVKPSPARWEWWPKMKIINQNIRGYCDSTESCTFIDVGSKMLTDEGEINKDIFVWDDLHLNEKGYKIWTKIIGKVLECKVNKGL